MKFIHLTAKRVLKALFFLSLSQATFSESNPGAEYAFAKKEKLFDLFNDSDEQTKTSLNNDLRNLSRTKIFARGSTIKIKINKIIVHPSPDNTDTLAKLLENNFLGKYSSEKTLQSIIRMSEQYQDEKGLFLNTSVITKEGINKNGTLTVRIIKGAIVDFEVFYENEYKAKGLPFKQYFERYSDRQITRDEYSEFIMRLNNLPGIEVIPNIEETDVAGRYKLKLIVKSKEYGATFSADNMLTRELYGNVNYHSSIDFYDAQKKAKNNIFFSRSKNGKLQSIKLSSKMITSNIDGFFYFSGRETKTKNTGTNKHQKLSINYIFNPKLAYSNETYFRLGFSNEKNTINLNGIENRKIGKIRLSIRKTYRKPPPFIFNEFTYQVDCEHKIRSSFLSNKDKSEKGTLFKGRASLYGQTSKNTYVFFNGWSQYNTNNLESFERGSFGISEGFGKTVESGERMIHISSELGLAPRSFIKMNFNNYERYLSFYAKIDHFKFFDKNRKPSGTFHEEGVRFIFLDGHLTGKASISSFLTSRYKQKANKVFSFYLSASI